MVSGVTLGSFFSENGKNVLGGSGGSGLDTKSIVDALVQAQTAANVKPLQDNVTLNNSKTTALSQLQTLVTSVQSAVNSLRGVPGFNTASQNAFAYVTASVSSNSAVAGANYLNVIAAPGAALQSYTVQSVTQLAQSTIQKTGTFIIASADTAVVSATPAAGSAGPPAVAGQFGAGTFTLTTAVALAHNPSGISITLNAGDSLNTVANDFNAVSSQTGIAANVVQASTGRYQLVFTSTSSGAVNGFDLTSPSTVSSGASVLANIETSTQQSAQDAQFTLNGVTVTRPTNTISDAISGLTFTLQQPTPGGTSLNINVSPDTTTPKNAIISFINAYNALKEFGSQQTQLNSDGTFASTAVLATDNVMGSAINTIASTISNVVNGLSGTINSLASIGVTFTDLPATQDSKGNVIQPYTRNVLTADNTALTNALTGNFQQVANLFQFTFNSANPNLSLFSGPTTLPGNNLTFVLNPGTSTFQAQYTDSNNTLQTVNLTATLSGGGTYYSLVAPTGSALSGMILIYASTAASTFSATASQGLADQIYNYTTALLTQNTGSIAVEQSALSTSNVQLQKQITTQNSLISTYQSQLLEKFSALEQAISNANTLLSSFNAQQAAQIGSAG